MVFGIPIILRPSSTSRAAVFCVPLPPMQTKQSKPSSLYVSTIREGLSTLNCFDFLNGFSREVPSIVPPRVRIPESICSFKGIYSFSINPKNPEEIPITSIPYLTIAVLPTPLIAAFNPGQSPPAVRMPILFFLFLTIA